MENFYVYEYFLHISALTQSRRQETLPATPRPQPQPAPAPRSLRLC